MRNGKSQIKISFRLRIIAWGWQEWMWFSERQPPVKIVFLILNKELFWKFLCKIAIALYLCLDDWDSCNALAPSSATCSELFHSGNWFWKWIWKTMGEVDLDFKWAISRFPHQISSTVAVVTIIIRLHQTPFDWFSQAPTASSMLNLSRGSEDCLAFFFCQKQGDCDFQFKSHRMRKIFRSVLTFCYEIIRSVKHHPLKNSKCLRSLKYDFQTQLDKIIVGWKAIHHHRANPNPHQRGSCTERKSALHHPGRPHEKDIQKSKNMV